MGKHLGTPQMIKLDYQVEGQGSWREKEPQEETVLQVP